MRRSTQSFKTVSVADLAVDAIAMGSKVQEFLRTREFELLRFVRGEKPTVFTLRAIDSNSFMSYVSNASSDGERFRRAFQFGVEMIEDMVVDGQAIPQQVPDQVQQNIVGTPLAIWSDEKLAKIPPIYLTEIGSVAFTRSFIDPKVLDAGRARYAPPPIVLRIMGARVCQDAADIAKAHQSLKSGTQSGADQTEQSGEPDTGAAATE